MVAILSHTTETENVELMLVYLYIIDGYTGMTVYFFSKIISTFLGEVIHTGYHRRVKGKLSMIFCENWLIYSYWAAKMHRTELTAVDLYEGQTDPNRTEWSSRPEFFMYISANQNRLQGDYIWL